MRKCEKCNQLPNYYAITYNHIANRWLCTQCDIDLTEILKEEAKKFMEIKKENIKHPTCFSVIR